MMTRVRMPQDKKLLLLLAALLLPACIHIHPSGVALAKDPTEMEQDSVSLEIVDNLDSPGELGLPRIGSLFRELDDSRDMPLMDEIHQLQKEIAQLQDQLARLKELLPEEALRGGVSGRKMARRTERGGMVMPTSPSGGFEVEEFFGRDHEGPRGGFTRDRRAMRPEWNPRGLRRNRVMPTRMNRGMGRLNRGMERPGMNPGGLHEWPGEVVMGRTGVFPGWNPALPEGVIIMVQPEMGQIAFPFPGEGGHFAGHGDWAECSDEKSCDEKSCDEKGECPYLKSQDRKGQGKGCGDSCESSEEEECEGRQRCRSEESDEESECPYLNGRETECCGDDGCCKGEKEMSFHGEDAYKALDLGGDLREMTRELMEGGFAFEEGTESEGILMILDEDMDIQIHTEFDGLDLPVGMKEELSELLYKIGLETGAGRKEMDSSDQKRSSRQRSAKEVRKEKVSMKKESNEKVSKKKASKKKESNEKASKKKASKKKDSKKKDSKKKDSKKKDSKKKRGGAVRKSESGSSMEIRVRELSRLGVPVF